MSKGQKVEVLCQQLPATAETPSQSISGQRSENTRPHVGKKGKKGKRVEGANLAALVPQAGAFQNVQFSPRTQAAFSRFAAPGAAPTMNVQPAASVMNQPRLSAGTQLLQPSLLPQPTNTILPGSAGTVTNTQLLNLFGAPPQ